MELRYQNRPRRESGTGSIVILVITAFALMYGGYHRSKKLEIAIVGPEPTEEIAAPVPAEPKPESEQLTQLIEGLIYDN